MVGWHRRLNGHEFEQTVGESEGLGSLLCHSPWGCKELDTTEWLNCTELNYYLLMKLYLSVNVVESHLLQRSTFLGNPVFFSPRASWWRWKRRVKKLASNSIFKKLRSWYLVPSVRFNSVTQLCPTLCDPMDCSTPSFPVHHQLPELAQTHVHQVGDAIQPSYPLLSPFPPAYNHFQHQGLFQWISSS